MYTNLTPNYIKRPHTHAHVHSQALFYMTAFLTKALCQGKGAGLPLWWPLGHAGTIALILAYVAVARYVRACVCCCAVYGWFLCDV